MTYPYKVVLEIEGELQEALLIDLLNNAKIGFKKGMCFDAASKLKDQYIKAIEEHKKKEHGKSDE